MMRQRRGNVDEIYSIEKEIGRGSIGSVKRCQHMQNKKSYALKTIQTSRLTREMTDELLNEIDILMGLDHPNIVRPIELFTRKRELYLVLQLCSGGDMYKRSPYSEADAARYVSQITDAVAYMHSFKVVHRDLKFENILFASKSPESEVMVIDFGLAKANYAAKRKLDEFVGTLYSMAPEVMRGSYDSKCDIWSLGVVTYMLLAGAMPFTRFDDEHALLRDLENERYDMKRRAMVKRSVKAHEFVRALLVASPNNRPSAEEVKQLPWIAYTAREAAAAEGGCVSPEQAEAGLESSVVDPSVICESLANYTNASKLRKIALMVVAHRSDNEAIKQLRAAFRHIDTANEGFIKFTELETLLTRAGPAYTPEVVREIFEAVDHDKTGRISYTEFLAAALEGTNMVREDELAEAFDRLDSDDTGFISKENLKQILGRQFSKELVDEMIADADYKNNGMIDFEEFSRMMQERRDKRKDALAHATLPSLLAM